jgi:hypothetical protein
MEVNVCLDSRAPQMAIENRFGRLQAHPLISAAEQLGKTLDRLRDSSASRVRSPSGGFWPTASVAGGTR